MAVALVGFVAEKLGDLVVKEAQLLGGVTEQVKSVQRELLYIKRYLADADSKRRKGDELAEHWLNELRGVAYRIEDAVDTFDLEVIDDQDNHVVEDDDNTCSCRCLLKPLICCCFFAKLKRLGRQVMKVPGLHKLGTELEGIQKQLENIFKSKDKYGIQPLPQQDDFHVPDNVDIVLPKRRAAYHEVDEAEIVGLDYDRNEVLRLLRSREKTPRRAVITIVGVGGLGKTTLARFVYDCAKVDFEYYTMLSVSQQFDPTYILRKILSEVADLIDIHDLLRKILSKAADLIKNSAEPEPKKQEVLDLIKESTNPDHHLRKIRSKVADLIKISTYPEPETQGVLEELDIIISKKEVLDVLDLISSKNVSDLISMLKKLLRQIKYLIILDDVWSVELWNQYLKHALPDDKNGSRVLITSRNEDVGKSADPGIELYRLGLLNDEQSLNLLLKTSLPNYHQETNKKCPSNLGELPKMLSKKCKGLPLALVVLGGILSIRDQTYIEWKKVFDTMDWSEEGKDCMNILALSYDDMPYNLKPCFLYLASFPEDYEISVKCLIRMWVAEGFIPRQERKTLEETAEIFLQQLLQRSMVQVAKREAYGSITYCRVHDLVRELAMEEAAKENFLTVQEKAGQGRGFGRRVSFQPNEEFMKYEVGLNTRSFFYFHLFPSTRRLDLAHYRAQFRLLRVLQIVGVYGFDPKGLDRLIHLKYLGIIKCHEVRFPDDFRWDRLRKLETLEFRGIDLLNWERARTIALLPYVIIIGR